MYALIAVAALLLAGTNPTHTGSYKPKTFGLFPGETEYADSVSVSSEVEAGVRKFEIQVKSSIIAAAPLQTAFWSVPCEHSCNHPVKGTKSSEGWHFNFAVSDSISWATKFFFRGRAQPRSEGSIDSTVFHFWIPLASRLALTEQERTALEAAKQQVAIDAVPRLSDQSYRRFIGSSLGVWRILGTNTTGHMRVRYVDGAYGLIPPRRVLPEVN